jgi:phosphoribosylamine--glycine ligase
LSADGQIRNLAWKIQQSSLVSEVLVAPGNAGTSRVGRNCPLPADPVAALPVLRELVRRERVDLVVVGPEAYLVAGLADLLRADGVAVFGPDQRAAEIEGSKSFAKRLMTEAGIPTARYQAFTEAGAALAYLATVTPPVVVKADGLAAGKGVVVAQTIAEAEAAVRGALEDGAFGAAGGRVVIEDFLDGVEASLFALADGENAVLLPAAEDYKRVGDGDQGPNTGGMGAVAPTPRLTSALREEARERIILPALRAMAEAGRPFRGLLYAGLMLTRTGPQVVEFNCRFGDPETQVVLPVLDGDLVPYLKAAAAPGGLAGLPELREKGAAVTVVLTAAGYPGRFERGLPLGRVEEASSRPGVLVFHAATREAEGQLVSSGGRVLNVTGWGASVAEARGVAYAAVAGLNFPGGAWRSDIGAGITPVR